MTLQQLYDEVDANADTIKRLGGDDLGHMVSVTILYKLNTGAGSIRRWIMIKNRGLGNEVAYWDGGKPEYLTAADSFPGLLKTQVETYQVAHPEFERYEIINTFNVLKYALVKGYVYDSGAGKTAIKNYIFFKNGATWYARELV